MQAEDHNGARRGGGLHRPDQPDDVHVSRLDVQEDDVRTQHRRLCERGQTVARLPDDRHVRLQLEPHTQSESDRRTILDQQHSDHASTASGEGASAGAPPSARARLAKNHTTATISKAIGTINVRRITGMNASAKCSRRSGGIWTTLPTDCSYPARVRRFSRRAPTAVVPRTPPSCRVVLSTPEAAPASRGGTLGIACVMPPSTTLAMRSVPPRLAG